MNVADFQAESLLASASPSSSPARSPASDRQVAEVLYATGHWLLGSGRFADASKVLRTMVLLASDDERGWLALGACHEGLAQPRIALELYRCGMIAAVPAPRCAVARAIVLRALGEPDAALEAFELAEELATQANDDEAASIAKSLADELR